jgi:hypothetical protein
MGSTVLARSLGLGLRLALAGAAPAALAELAGSLPPPGLYSIDMDSTFRIGVASVRNRSDAANGERSVRTILPGVDSGEQRAHDGAPLRHCVKAIVAAHSFDMGPDGAVLKCGRQSTRTVGETTVHRAVCPGGNLTLTLRRLDASHWEYLSEVESGGSGVPVDLNAVRPMLEQAAREGKTAQARREAQQRLAALPALQAETTAKRAAARDALEAALRKERDPAQRAALQKTIDLLAGSVGVTGRTRYVWTRIADTCD